MHRPLVLGVTLAAVVAVAFAGWTAVGREREFRRLLVTGDAAVASERILDGVEAFSGALALRPDAMVAYLKRGDAHRRRGEMTTALRDLQQAHSLDRTAPDPLESLGDVTAALDRHADAARHYRDYLAVDDRSAPIHYKLGLSMYRDGQPKVAMESLRRAIALDSSLGEAHYLLGLIARDLGQLREARTHLSTAIRTSPGLVAARLALAAVDRTTRARLPDQLRAVLARTPSTPDEAGAVVQAALDYADMGDTDRAARELLRASAALPDNATISLAIGYVWVTAAESGDREARLKTLNGLAPLAADPEARGDVLALYGRALLLDRQFARAEHALTQASERPPVVARAYRDLADAARRLGHHDTARRASARHEALAAIP